MDEEVIPILHVADAATARNLTHLATADPAMPPKAGIQDRQARYGSYRSAAYGA